MSNAGFIVIPSKAARPALRQRERTGPGVTHRHAWRALPQTIPGRAPKRGSHGRIEFVFEGGNNGRVIVTGIVHAVAGSQRSGARQPCVAPHLRSARTKRSFQGDSAGEPIADSQNRNRALLVKLTARLLPLDFWLAAQPAAWVVVGNRDGQPAMAVSGVLGVNG